MANRRPAWFITSGVCLALSVITYPHSGPLARWNSPVVSSMEPPPAALPQTSELHVPAPAPVESAPLTSEPDPNPEPAPDADLETTPAVSELNTQTQSVPAVPPANVPVSTYSSWGRFAKPAPNAPAGEQQPPPKIIGCVQQDTGDRVIEARGQTVGIVCTGSNFDRVRQIALVDQENNGYTQMKGRFVSAETDRLLFDFTAPNLHLPSPYIAFSDGNPPQRTGLVIQGPPRLPQQATMPKQDNRTPIERGMDILEPLFRPHPRQ